MATEEREITEPVDLCTASGLLNPAAIGWTRTPLQPRRLGASVAVDGLLGWAEQVHMFW